MSRNGPARRIGNVVRDLRRALGLSRRHLAELSGAHIQTIGALERGDQQPSLDLAMRISAAFGRPVQEVFFWADSSTTSRDG
ncbi:helix-turn-helix transcriptional regulator [Rhodococcus gordoniae]|uniref:helix-turn-helix transcriptional regulator n=1 Tax=Rhodococcus gordoniae TaxID=223392 RepID=UPI0020CFE422|nr:helix-turn-helix domain-containing protein [Rhodococcus gordoniae]UTT51163.1 helix-turn-helix domain-containing protein [Rhodococcus gordoniae]